MKKLKVTLIVLTVLLALGLGAAAGGYYWYRENHVKVNGLVYDIHTAEVDLRGQETTLEEYEALHGALPGAAIHWDVPFQDTRYPNDTQEITVKTLTMEDLDRLSYLPELNHVLAPECRDYEVLTELESRSPDMKVDFKIHIGKQQLDRGETSLSLGAGEGNTEELQAVLKYLPGMKTVTLEDPSIPAADLYALQEQYPEASFTWNKVYEGNVYTMDETFLNLSATHPESIQAVEDFAAYFPNLTQLDMEDCGFENEDMAAFRDRVRDRYKVVWGVHVGEAYLRTDVTHFMPGQANTRVHNDETYNLRYCEDLIAVDFGHVGISNLEWVVGTPHIKYLIIGDGDVFDEDIVPIGTLKELEWLEIFNSPVKDVSPLVGCTALKDLLLSGSYIDVEPLGQMPWLENIWLLRSGINGQDITYLHEHCPNAHLEVGTTKHAHSHGWRHLPRYFEMRDAFEMWYMEG